MERYTRPDMQVGIKDVVIDEGVPLGACPSLVAPCSHSQPRLSIGEHFMVIDLQLTQGRRITDEILEILYKWALNK